VVAAVLETLHLPVLGATIGRSAGRRAGHGKGWGLFVSALVTIAAAVDGGAENADGCCLYCYQTQMGHRQMSTMGAACITLLSQSNRDLGI
jgi:hypothetical protein